MFRDPAFIESAIVNQRLTRAVVFDTNRKEKLDYCEAANPAELVDQFRAWLKMLHGPVRVEAWPENGFDETGGKENARRQRCTWLVMGQAGTNEPAPLQPIYQSRTEPTQPAPDVDLRVRLAVMELELKHEREAREALLATDDDDDDEEDDEDEPARPSFSIDPDTLREVRGIIAELFGPKVPAPVQPITGAPAAIGSGPISGDADYLAALDRMAAQHPDTAKEWREKLLSSYGKG